MPPKPSPRNKKKTKDSPKPKKPPVHPRVKAITRHFRAHIATVRKFFATDDEAKDVVDSLARFAGKVPLLETCRYDETKLGALRGLNDGTALALSVLHQRECQRLANHLRDHTLPEFNRSVDEMIQLCERAHELLPGHPDATPCDPWDASQPAGSCPMSSLELITWMEDLNHMFIDELWRKETLVENMQKAVWTGADADDAAAVTKAAARLWPRRHAESFVDCAFLEIVLTNHDMLL